MSEPGGSRDHETGAGAWSSLPERVKRRLARFLHATWPERPEHFCRDNGCQLAYLCFVSDHHAHHVAQVMAENKRLRDLAHPTLMEVVPAKQPEEKLTYEALVEENERLRAFAFGDAPEWERANASLKHRVRELEATVAALAGESS